MNANAVIALLAWERIKWKARVVQAQFLWASPLPVALWDTVSDRSRNPQCLYLTIWCLKIKFHVPYALQASFALTWFNMGAADDGEWRTKASCCGQSCGPWSNYFHVRFNTGHNFWASWGPKQKNPKWPDSWKPHSTLLLANCIIVLSLPQDVFKYLFGSAISCWRGTCQTVNSI